MGGIQTRWHVIRGYGGHIKATSSLLTVQQKGEVHEFPLSSIDHLIVVGGHNLHTSAVIHLLRNNSPFSFFDADGEPLGILRPHGFEKDREIQSIQKDVLPYSYGVEIARAAFRSRLIAIEGLSERMETKLFYAGELDLLHQSFNELEYLVKMDELRRLHKLGSDMYYEIIARSIPPEIGFKRRIGRPHLDPVNAMLSLGYAVLFGNCSLSVEGAFLNPDLGMLSQGAASLVHDFIEPLKSSMVDSVVVDIVREGLRESEYDCSGSRCHLDESLASRLIERLHHSVDVELIDQNILNYRDSIISKREFHFLF